MSRPSVLIAAFSGRALAQSARAAGYDPLVVDAFGDDDMVACAQSSVLLRSALGSGFHRKSLNRALDALVAQALSPPIGLVLGTGFEDQPQLIDELAGKFLLLGNDGQTVAKCKDPAFLFPLLSERGIPHPETSLRPRDDPAGWIVKRVGGSGGLHIAPCPNDASRSNSPDSYTQRVYQGTPLSVCGVVSKRGFVIGICRQWLAPLSARPYRFGGIVSPVDLDPDTEARMIDVAVELTRALDLKGFVSFDFLDTGADILLLEVNPRPTAGIDVLDGVDGHMFKAHVAACLGEDPSEIVSPKTGTPPIERPEGARAIGYLYADSGPIEVGQINWPDWACDRPVPGRKISQHRPLASVTVSARRDDEAEKLCRSRLGELAQLLYGDAR